jgi:hypothetical protein
MEASSWPITVQGKLQQFADDGDRTQVHTFRNLVLALTGEVGELAELYERRPLKNPVQRLTKARADKRTGKISERS